MIEFRPFDINDALYLHGKAVDKLFNEYSEQFIMDTESSDGLAYSVLVDGEIVAVAGIKRVREGLGEMWAVVSQDAPRSTKLFRALRQMLAISAKHGGFSRLRSKSRKGFAQSQRFLEFFGFEQKRLFNDNYIYTKRC